MKQILIADKYKENLLSARLILESGTIIYPARSKNWMLKVLKQKNIDIIIINVNLAGYDGTVELLEKIRKSDRYSNVPFIIAGTNDPEDIVLIRKCMKLGNCEAISLPYDNSELKQVINEM